MANRKNTDTIRTDIYKISPYDIEIQEGFNSRIDFSIDDEFVKSISRNGVLNPISVIPYFNHEEEKEKYMLVDGERRYRATLKAISQGADIKRIPALFLSKSITKEEQLIQQLVRNDGKRFNEYENALAMKKIMDVGNYTAGEVLEKLGWEPWKAIFLTHLERDPQIQSLMKEGKIEGSEVRKIYQAHKDDETGAVKEILAASEYIGKDVVYKSKNGKESKKTAQKVTLGLIESTVKNSRTISKRDSEKILAGFRVFYKYLSAYKGKISSADIDIVEIYGKLKEGGDIVDILNSLMFSLKEVE